MARLGNPLPTCNPDYYPLASYRSGDFTPRRAVDSNGKVGWLYDASTDQVLSDSEIKFNIKWLLCRALPSCFMDKYNPGEPDNLLNMVPTNGMGALINYSNPIDKYTRRIIYTHYSRTEYLEDKIFSSWKKIDSQRPNSSATHIIVFVNWGIDASVLLQLPPDGEVTRKIDHVLEKICESLKNQQNSLTFSEEDNKFLNKIRHTEVFSNIQQLTNINSILQFYRTIPSMHRDTSLHKAYNYNLYPIDYFYAQNNESRAKFIPLRDDTVLLIETYLVRLSLDFKRIRKATNQNYPNLKHYLRREFDKMQEYWREFETAYGNQIHRLRGLVIRARLGDIDEGCIPNEFNDDQNENLTKMIKDCTVNLESCAEKEQLIKELLDKGVKYQNALDRNIQNGDNEQALKRKLSISDDQKHFIFSNDDLYKNRQSSLCTLRDQLLQEHGKEPRLQLIYVDFTYCSYKLDDVRLFPTIGRENFQSTSKTATSSSQAQSRNDEIMNVLLLGETGVGKSTFINAFVNYLKFNELDEAKNDPVVLIPVSFTLTTGDNFKEEQIKFEGEGDLYIENFENVGESVTQHCKSYIFTVKDGENRARKLRIVDTPGIGDTRGLTQDEANLQHILTFINSLSYLNAVCILLKPNNARLTGFFRSCFLQLIDMLSENICDKIIFCFTNSRPAFYTPGNTAAPLRALLESLPSKNIPFRRENTFCFDSKSFRCLVAIRQGIHFSAVEEQEYNESWIRSSKESQRLIAYISTRISTDINANKLQSMIQAQLKINLLIRPMLETMRNILRNIILCDEDSQKTFIELQPISIKIPTAIYLKCPRGFVQIGGFWCKLDSLHVVTNNKCKTCDCDASDHCLVDYDLQCKISHDLSNTLKKDLEEMLNNLCEKSAEFHHFLLRSSCNPETDEFLDGLDRMIKEEEEACNKNSPHELNMKLIQALQELKEKYKNQKKEMARRKQSIELTDIYQKITSVSEFKMIASQISAIHEWHKEMIKYYQHEVST
ncbi:unnamed protein product [Rotaria sp. Silwood2]|nr:unnamed protein product [Rotaria sp. Silwood2]